MQAAVVAEEVVAAVAEEPAVELRLRARAEAEEVPAPAQAALLRL